MPKPKQQTYWNFVFKKRRFRVLIDKVLFLRFLRNVHGRYWGITAISGMLIGFAICYFIRPDLLRVDMAISEFGNDVRTAPFFAGSVFFAAYGLWRWRKYLARTWKRSMPVTGLITLTIIGLYLTALMPISWKPGPYYVHLFGVSLAGLSMLATVVLDGLLTTTRASSTRTFWRFWRGLSFISIAVGGWITFGSADVVAWYKLDLLGEAMMLFGYFIWIWIKTYHGEGRRTLLSKFLKDFVLVD